MPDQAFVAVPATWKIAASTGWKVVSASAYGVALAMPCSVEP